MSDNADAYLLPAEVADLLRASKKTAYRLAANPECPVLRLGGSIRFPRNRFLRWLEAHEQGRGRGRGRRAEGRDLPAGQIPRPEAAGR
jgi:excisionase family DNA binding protein